MMNRTPRIALIWYVYRRGNDSIRGIADYAERFGPWQFLFNQIADIDVHRLPTRDDLDGIIIFRDFEGNFWDGVHWPPHVPIVSIEHQYSQITPYQVMPDYVATGKMVAEEFIRRGYRRFAYYARRDLDSSLPYDVWEREQLAGFSQTVRESGGELIPPPAVPREWGRPEHERPNQELANWFRALPRPMAIMAGSDVRSHHILLAAAAAGVRVPEEVAVIGVDNEQWTAIASGGLSSVEFDEVQAGYLAAQMLHQLMEKKPLESKIVRVSPRRLITRRSSDALAIDDADVVSALRFIADHSNFNIQVAQVVDAVVLSRRTLERRFQMTLHRSIQDEIRLAHIGRAKSLLRDKAIPLERVALMSGFVSLKAMEAVFRRTSGITPAAWRDQSLAGAGA